MDPTAEGYGGEYKFVTLKHDYTSYQTAQVWQDDPSVCILSSFFSLHFHTKAYMV